jgi:hypothetical protein
MQQEGSIRQGHPGQTSRGGASVNERVIVECVDTSCSRFLGFPSAGTRTKHTSSAGFANIDCGDPGNDLFLILGFGQLDPAHPLPVRTCQLSKRPPVGITGKKRI